MRSDIDFSKIKLRTDFTDEEWNALSEAERDAAQEEMQLFLDPAVWGDDTPNHFEEEQNKTKKEKAELLEKYGVTGEYSEIEIMVYNNAVDDAAKGITDITTAAATQLGLTNEVVKGAVLSLERRGLVKTGCYGAGDNSYYEFDVVDVANGDDLLIWNIEFYTPEQIQAFKIG